MKPSRPACIVALTLMFIMGACGPRPVAPAAPVLPADTPLPATNEPAATVPTEAVPASVVASPVMEVGSAYPYFDGSLLLPVPEGPFVMGGSGEDAPVRMVDLDDFWIYEVEVTNRMYNLCVEVGRCSPPDPDDNPLYDRTAEANKPVVGVNWAQATDYCEFANGRLPTEAEWENAARGPDGNKFPWGNAAPACSLLNFDGCVHKTTQVGTYPEGESFYKALDMAGNAFEWVADWYDRDYYASAPSENPGGPPSGTERSIRSSAFNTDGYLTEVARRFHGKPTDHRADLGFRCVVEDPAAFAPFCTQLLVYGKPAPIGQGTGEILNAACNKPDVQQALLNCNQTNLTIDAGGGPLTYFDINTERCHPTADESLWWCEPGAGWVKICGDCKVEKPSEANCEAGYHQEGKLCVIDQGRPGICPEGSIYDEQLMCCSPLPGPGFAYHLCASWASFYQGVNEDDPSYCFKGDFPGRQCWSGPVEFKEGCGVPNQPNCDEDPTLPGCGDPCTGPNCVPVCNPSTGEGCQTNCNPTTGAGCGPLPGVCLSGGALIDTPAEPVAVQRLQVGDPVWTMDAGGVRFAATVLQISSVPTIPGQQILHIRLSDGREIRASSGHPTADGRTLGQLKIGDELDGATVTATESLDNPEAATYDVLPSGGTGYYWANGILLGSTLSGR